MSANCSLSSRSCGLVVGRRANRGGTYHPGCAPACAQCRKTQKTTSKHSIMPTARVIPMPRPSKPSAPASQAARRWRQTNSLGSSNALPDTKHVTSAGPPSPVFMSQKALIEEAPAASSRAGKTSGPALLPQFKSCDVKVPRASLNNITSKPSAASMKTCPGSPAAALKFDNGAAGGSCVASFPKVSKEAIQLESERREVVPSGGAGPPSRRTLRGPGGLRSPLPSFASWPGGDLGFHLTSRPPSSSQIGTAQAPVCWLPSSWPQPNAEASGCFPPASISLGGESLLSPTIQPPKYRNIGPFAQSSGGLLPLHSAPVPLLQSAQAEP
mmetsp:Transcript_136650/g.340763  ORF Transcript_136650/g.340763 Transcript_136650/m.340763 type:complete len:327 (+) Transcript_136650:446-1426(+)